MRMPFNSIHVSFIPERKISLVRPGAQNLGFARDSEDDGSRTFDSMSHSEASRYAPETIPFLPPSYRSFECSLHFFLDSTRGIGRLCRELLARVTELLSSQLP